MEIIRINKGSKNKFYLPLTYDELGVVDWKFVHSDLPRPNLVEEDSYDGGRVKISAAGASTTATRLRQRSSSSAATMKVAVSLGLEISSEGSEIERGKCSLRRVRGIYSHGEKTLAHGKWMNVPLTLLILATCVTHVL